MTTFPVTEVVHEIKEELRYRRRVYSRLVSIGKMSQAGMDRKIAIMAQVLADYEAKAAAESPGLFG